MALTKENISFIDTYLENSNVLFADIRMEMVDHVASQIETNLEAGDNRGFYIIFKEYMLKNKALLLNNNKQFIKQTDKAIFNLLAKQLFLKSTLILTILLFCINFYVINNIKLELIVKFILAIPILSVIPFIVIYLLAKYKFNVPRFSSIERLGFVYMALCQIFNLFISIIRGYVKENSEISYYLISLLITTLFVLFIILIQVTFKLLNSYKTRYLF